MPFLNTLLLDAESVTAVLRLKFLVTFCHPSGLVPFFYVTVLYWPFSPPCHLFSCQHGEATVQCIHGNQSVFDVADFSAQSCLPPPSINHFHFLFPQPQQQGRLSVNALCFCALWTHELWADSSVWTFECHDLCHDRGMTCAIKDNTLQETWPLWSLL